MSARLPGSRLAAALVVVALSAACGSAANESAAPVTRAVVAPGTGVAGTAQPSGSTTAPAPATTPGTLVPSTAAPISSAPPTSRPPLAPPPSRPPATPRPTAPPPTTVAHADDFSFDECGHDGAVDPAAVAKGAGPGPVVGIIGDSITTQVRFGLLAGGTRHWVVWSRCGASVSDALRMGAPPAVMALRPAVVVVALGTNDAGYPNPAPGDSDGFAGAAEQLLAQLAAAPCVVWVDVAQVGDAALQAEMSKVDTAIDALSLRGVRVVRWTDVVAGDPGVLVDRVHLSWHGVERRIALLNDAITRCSG